MHEKEYDNFLQELDAARDVGLYDEALAMLDEQIAIDPDVDGFYYGKAYILHHDLGKHKEAMREIEKSLYLLPNEKNGLCLLGRIYFSLTRYQEALQIFNEILKQDAEFQEAWFYKAAIFDKQTKYQEGLDIALHLLTLNPKHLGGLEYKLHYLNKLRKHEEVVVITQDLINKNSKDIVGYFYQMAALYELARYAEALECSEMAYRNLSTISAGEKVNYERDIILYQTLILEELSRESEVEEKLVSFLTINPEHIAALERLAYLYLKQDRYEEVLTLIERITAIDLGYNQINFLKGYAYYRLMNYPKAIEHFALAISQDNLSFNGLDEALKYEGYAYEQLGQHRLAIECHQQSLRNLKQTMDNGNEDSGVILKLEQLAYVNIAICLFRSGEMVLAGIITNEVLESSPKHVNALFMQAKLHNHHKRYKEAIEITDQIIKDNSDCYPYIYSARAVGLFGLGRYEEAISSFISSVDPKIITPLAIQRYQEALEYLSSIKKPSIRESRS